MEGVDWTDPTDVELFLLDVESAQGSDSLAWLDAKTTPQAVRDAVIATITLESCYVQGWPSPTTYKSYAKGHMNLGVGGDWNRYPWIQHIVYGAGTVRTRYHD